MFRYPRVRMYAHIYIIFYIIIMTTRYPPAGTDNDDYA